MLSFKRDKINKKEHLKEENENISLSNNTEIYSHEDWMKDFNMSHNIENESIKIENPEQKINYSANKEIFEELINLNNYKSISEETFLKSETEVADIKQKEKKIEKKHNLSTRAKIHLTIYTLLLMFVFSIVISNAVIHNYNKNSLSADGGLIKVEEKDLSFVVLPNGEKIKVDKKKVKDKSDLNDNKFDRFTNKLESLN